MRKETVLDIMRTSGRNVKVSETAGEGGPGLSPELMALRATRLLRLDRRSVDTNTFVPVARLG
jgi:hypothetical protein